MLGTVGLFSTLPFTARRFGAGDVGLAEDTTGKGHNTVSDGGAYLAITELQ